MPRERRRKQLRANLFTRTQSERRRRYLEKGEAAAESRPLHTHAVGTVEDVPREAEAAAKSRPTHTHAVETAGEMPREKRRQQPRADHLSPMPSGRRRRCLVRVGGSSRESITLTHDVETAKNSDAFREAARRRNDGGDALREVERGGGSSREPTTAPARCRDGEGDASREAEAAGESRPPHTHTHAVEMAQ